MKFRVKEIAIPDDDIYKHDALDRKPTVEFIQNFLSRLEGPFTLALDSPWGTGKTTTVHMLRKELKAKEAPSVYFNAWKNDFATDPLVALVSVLDELAPKDPSARQRFLVHMSKVKKLTTSVAKHGTVAIVKAGTLGVLNIEPVIENVIADTAADVTKDLVEALKKEKASLETLRDELEKAIAELSKDEEAKPLYFFIDELDRCRPSFAIELLERIKHLFDVEGVVFILSIDKKQLEAAIGAVYGDRFDSNEYLRRFFDMELRLPVADAVKFTSVQVNSYGLSDYFAERGRASEMRYDGENISRTIAQLTILFGLNLRGIERAMGRIALVCSQTGRNRYLDPILIAFLVVLRIKRSELFERILTGTISPSQMMEEIRKLPGGIAFADSHEGIIIETYLIAGDSDEQRKEKTVNELQKVSNPGSGTSQSSRASEIVGAMRFIPQGSYSRRSFTVAGVAAKVDMAGTLSR